MSPRSSTPASHRRVSRRAWALVATGLVALLSAAAAGGAAATAPRVVSHAPLGTRNDHPTLVVFLEHASGLVAHDLRISVNGVDVSRFASVRANEIQVPLQGVGEGRHDVRLRTGPLGMLRRKLDARWTFIVDTKAPGLRVAAPVGHRATSDVRNTRFRVRTEPGASVRLGVGRHSALGRADAAGNATVRLRLREGNQRVRIVARDVVGNTTRRGKSVFVDSLPPSTRFHIPASVDSPELDVLGQASDANGVTVEATLDGTDEGLLLEPSGRIGYRVAALEDLAEGVHRIEFVATDGFGHRSVIERRFLVNSSERLGDNALGRGARGADVRQLHGRLRALGFFSKARAQGEWQRRKYGPATSRAVRAFQNDKRIAADGLVGDDTLAAMTLKIVINRAQHSLTLYRLDEVEKVYGVAVGSPMYPTPAGEYHIVNKQEQPTWTPPPESDWAKDAKPIPPGPGNPLGTRWMGLDTPNVGIHGTNSPTSIGYSVSHGCIRMSIPMVEDLFDRVRTGTPVEII